MNTFNYIKDVWEYLDKIPKFQDKGASASNFELEDITKFCRSIGDPQNSFPSIHVAGTNGKGTTCHLLEAVYQKAGYKTGLFTSPHLFRYHERFRINGEETHDEHILKFFQSFSEELAEIPLTYFEISTALAFWIFEKEEVDIAIIETGLGGRLDSTNIIDSELSIITSIGLDHQDILGATEAEIAKEKAGIIKSEKPVILGNIFGESEHVIIGIAEKKNAKVFKVRELIPEFDKGSFSLKNESLFIQTHFVEDVNKWNLAAVYQAVKVLEDQFKVYENDLMEAFEEFKGVPARFEKLDENKNWYFSGAHNVQALTSTMQTIDDLEEDAVFIFSIMKDKLVPEVIEIIKEREHKFYFELNTERAASFKDIKQRMSAEKIDENTYKSILKEFETSLVIFTGSFYFYSTVKRWVSNC
ncbi:MAG: bifunctional folylpolyglutamate synthase/dihydrofolate synthase [Balneola sp.]|nr:bifunctional folylpolyglutamate synthase/dihydrofolate synthase [Balneola sp.]MBO6650451.1 bifunctional folylpolyglutamate synthase/dihydrofolate synthase [Balneola sp.]MBO6710153.1 bifunctional folylpolyglutamate synthase/dihydrofolate synthase [Balneola sp.]MBO6798837.1 bifunctional folylpolyglutamate synthase/dihydrofolate synthase [Balneola sp.]